MAKDPAFLFYTSDFLTGTMFMSNEDVGKYIRLLCAQHQHGGRISISDFEAVAGENFRLLNKFKKDENGYYNERLSVEIMKRKRDADASRENGKLGGRPLGKKPKHNLKITQRKPKTNLPENENEIEDYFVSKGYSKESAKKFFEYYSTSGWKDSKGNPVLNWKQKAQAVWFTEENKIKELINNQFISHIKPEDNKW